MRTWLPLGILVTWLVLAVFGAALPLEPNAIELSRILDGPALGHWLGYDELGRPVFDRLVAGARTSFFVSVFVVALSTVVGVLVGAVSGWLGGWFDLVVVRIIDVFLAFPGILLAIALAGVLGPGIGNVVIALAAVGWVGFARLARAQTLSIKSREHVLAAVALGASGPRIVRVHVVPFLVAPLTVAATFDLAGVIIAEAGLSFLGLGVQPPAASWGTLIREGTRYMLVSPHLVIAPALTLLAIVLSVNLLGDWLRDALDVRAGAARR